MKPHAIRLGLISLLTVGLSAATAAPSHSSTVSEVYAESGRDAVVAHRHPSEQLGVASFNVLHTLPPGQAWADVVRLTERHDVDIVGWQEAERHGRIFGKLANRGWRTVTYPGSAGEAAVSWRGRAFSLVKARSVRMHDGAGARLTDYPFPPRWVTVVTLRRKADGRLVTVLNTHLNQRVERWETRPGHIEGNLNARRALVHLQRMKRLFQDAPGRYVFATGDLNIDAAADARVRARGFPARVFHRIATANWDVFSTSEHPITHPSTGRSIDYVYADADATRRGVVSFEAQEVLGGYHSDHRPVVVRFTLR